MDVEHEREPSGSLKAPLDLIGGPFAVLESDPGDSISWLRWQSLIFNSNN